MRKRLDLFALFAVLCVSTQARASEPSPQHMLSVDVGRLVWSLIPPRSTLVVPLEYEGAVGEVVSLFVAPRLAFNANGVGLGLGVGARFYILNGPALTGLWLGPELGVLYGSVNSSTASATIAFSAGAGLGYNLLLGKSLMLSPGINFGFVGLGSSTVLVDYSPRLVLGYAF